MDTNLENAVCVKDLKVEALSDLHGQLLPLATVKECDVLCICGDSVPLNIQNYHKGTIKWFRTEFLPELKKCPAKQVLLIGGNHDMIVELYPNDIKKLCQDTKVTYLLDEAVNIEGYTFYGTPWCHKFGNWAFMGSDEFLTEKFSNIPDNVDYLLTHDAPWGVSDVVDFRPGQHIGSMPLRAAIELKQPKYCLHGHLHSANHECEILGKTKVYNVSLLNERYTWEYPILKL